MKAGESRGGTPTLKKIWHEKKKKKKIWHEAILLMALKKLTRKMLYSNKYSPGLWGSQ